MRILTLSVLCLVSGLAVASNYRDVQRAVGDDQMLASAGVTPADALARKQCTAALVTTDDPPDFFDCVYVQTEKDLNLFSLEDGYLMSELQLKLHNMDGVALQHMGRYSQVQIFSGDRVTALYIHGKSCIDPAQTEGVYQWLTAHGVQGSLRVHQLPSAEVDSTGKVYVVWNDCRFRSGCAENDIVMSTSTNGQTWTAPVRIPIDPTNSTVDHFLPGIGVEQGTGGATAHLGLIYYFYPTANCTSTTCRLTVGFVESSDGGTTWSAPVQVQGPMRNTWLPNTTQGYMVGDYMSTSFAGTQAYPVFIVARQGTCQLGQVTSCKEGAAIPTGGLAAGSARFVAGGDPVRYTGPSQAPKGLQTAN